MLTLRNAVTRPHWTSMHDYVINRMRVCSSKKVAPRVWRIDSGSQRKLYYCLDEVGSPTAWLYLYQRKGWKAWEVYQVWTFPEHRGQGLAERLYKAAINEDGLLLASGNLHTQYSQALWRSFIRRRLFNIWAHDLRNLNATSTVELDDDELVCDLPIYVDAADWRKYDVRLLALRKDQP